MKGSFRKMKLNVDNEIFELAKMIKNCDKNDDNVIELERRLIKTSHELIKAIVKKYANKYSNIDKLIGVGNQTLLEVVSKYRLNDAKSLHKLIISKVRINIMNEVIKQGNLPIPNHLSDKIKNKNINDL